MSVVNESWLRDVLSNKFKITQWKGVKISNLNDANSFTSSIYRITPDWSGENLPTSLILKKPKMQGNIDEHVMRMFVLCEMEAYTLFATVKTPPISVPNVQHLYEFNGCADAISMIMDDLSNFNIVNVYEGLNEHQVYSLLDALIKFHAFCFSNVEWKKIMHNQFPTVGDATFSNVISEEIKRYKSVFPDSFSKSDIVIENVKNYYGTDWYGKYIMKCASEKMIYCIAHGDLWTSNLFWKGNELHTVIDWQMIHCGSVTEDILRILSTSVRVELRKSITQPILKYYYKNMKDLLTKLGIRIPYSSEDLQINYHQTLLITASRAIFDAILWSTSPVLCKGEADDEKRMVEIAHRVNTIIDDAIESYSILSSQ